MPRKKTEKKIVVLGTGGTIAGRSADARDNVGYTAGQVGVDELLAGVRGQLAIGVETEQVAQIDSADMVMPVWQRLAMHCMALQQQADVCAIVVTHGTDTMEETAFFLHALLSQRPQWRKPVVLTGAMRPASSFAPDGPANLRDAFTVATDPAACGVLVVFAGTVHRGVDVRKEHPYRLDAFSSGDAGPAGYVEEGAVRWLRSPQVDVAGWLPQLPLRALCDPSRLPDLFGRHHDVAWPRVEIVLSHAGSDGLLVDAIVAQRGDAISPLRGIVVAGTGNGTVHASLGAALQRAAAQGVVVVRSTRCSRGRIVVGAGDSRWAHSAGLDPVKARIALMLGLMCREEGPAAASD